MNGKQRTLFQAWGSGVAPEPRRAPEPPAKKAKIRAARKVKSVLDPPRAAPPVWQVTPQQDEAEDDDVLLVAVYEAEKTLNATVTEHVPPDPPCTTHIQNLPGFDLSAGNVWIYPTNFPVREYQFTMAHAALLNNTLVCLPTGLGKTFIAAVVMYNFYRWYPSGKIVFMAPTKPLVAQQIEACFRVMGIPQEHMVEMTGNTQAQNRRDMWQCHRVFFLTPQIMVNDLTRGACPASEIKCLVIDEAHKALGNHAYCQVVRELSNYTKQFRILALSATPGGDTKAVQQVVSNLLIGQIELRSEDSPDILPYSHERQLEKFVVPLGDELEVVQKAYLQVLETFAGRLIQNNVVLRRDIPNLTKYQIILFRDQFRKNPPSNIVGAQMGVVEGDFALCISLYHGYELLLQMGTRSLYYYLRSIMDGSKGMTRARNDLSRNTDFMRLYQQLESMFSAPSGSDVAKPYIYSHPKLKKLEEVVIEHFDSWKKKGQNSDGKAPEDTRIMIFSSFRDSVQEIADLLNRHHPTVRVMTFVGHSSTGKGVKGFTQKEQLEVVKRFREGGYNTLVSTCVGEEGLDIGEVDLIICFDAQKSPIRLVQRMGRTGRKRQGRIAVILSKGREERTYNQSQSNKRSIYKAILANDSIFHLNHESPRMVPEGLNPSVHKMYITQRTYDAKDSAKQISKDRRSSLVHRKSSVFFNKESTNKEDGLLTPEEYETWNRLYRLTESEGVADVVLPRTQFELFRDPETNKEQASGNVHELSLSEWTLWQNRPFPTHFVDHSVRTDNFIAIMELIEQMRGEEGECSYDKEMNAFLNKAEMWPKQARQDCSAVTSKPSKKLQALKNKTCQNTLLMTENDEDFVPLFKSLRKAKSSSSDHENADLMDCATAMEISSDAEDACDLDENQDSVDEMEIGPCGDVNPGSSELPKKSPTAQNQATKSPTKADSGYHSFNEDNSEVLPNLFYTQHMHNNHYLVSEIIEKTSHVLSNMLSRVKNFLTCSPPPLSELDSLEDIDLCRIDLTTRGSVDISVKARCSVQELYTKNPDSLVDAACPLVKKNYAPQEELCVVKTAPLLSPEDYHVEAVEAKGPSALSPQDYRVEAVEEIEPSALSSQGYHVETVEKNGPLALSPPEDHHVETVEKNGPLALSPPEDHHVETVEKNGPLALSPPEDHHVETVEKNGPLALSPPEDHHVEIVEKNGSLALSPPEDHHVETVRENGLEDREDQNDRQWNDIFDSDGDETYIENFDSPMKRGCTQYPEDVENGKAQTEKWDFLKICSPNKNNKVKKGEMNSAEISMHSLKFNKEKTDSDETDIETSRTCSPHQSNHNTAHPHKGENELDFPDYLEDSFDLFEDEKFAEVDELSSSKAVTTKKHSHERTIINFNMFDASLLMDDHTEPDTTAGLSSCKNLEETEIEDELGSCELFSVNFDLGFSIDDDDDDDGNHSAEKPEEVKSQSVENAGLFKAPSPPKRTALGGCSMSTPVNFGVRSSTFEKQISPVGDQVSQMLKKSLSSSVVTPVIEKVNNFKAPYSPVAKNNYTHSTPHTGPKNVNSSLVIVRPNTDPAAEENDHTVTIGSSPDSEEDVVFRRKRKLAAAAVLKSPESTSSEYDFDSPMPGAKKHRKVHNTKLSSDDDLDSPMPGAKKCRLALNTVFSDDEDLEIPSFGRKPIVQDKGCQRDTRGPKHKRKRHAARQFLDEEAELSEEEAEYVSSDESVESDNEQDTSLAEFLNDNTQLSQALNDSEMHGIYMKSIRSPAVGNKYKMTHKRHSLSVFSQIPEQDEDYMEDSFCVQEDDEEEEEDSSTEEVQMDLNLLHQDSFVDGRRQYSTRRRLKLKGIQSKQANQVQPAKKKRRIIIHEDSSDDEAEAASAHQTSKANTSSLKSVNASTSDRPLPESSSSRTTSAMNEKKELFAIPLKDRCQMRINAQAALSEELDFQTDAQPSLNTTRHRASNSNILSTDKLDDTSASDSTWMGSSMNTSIIGKVLGSAASNDKLCILADSREISSGPEVISCLKSTHGVQVEICSLGGCDYIVSNRLSVERKSQSEFSNCSNRSKMAERIRHLRNMFDRVCLILEKDRVKPGETSRIFQRTKYYDSSLSALISAGVQILFSSNQEETAGLLKELASLERRKNTAIAVPIQVTGGKQEALNFYLSIPNVSYITALNLCHHFSSVRQMANSSVDDLSSKGQVSHQKAEEIYRYLHYQFDPHMLQTGDKRRPL